MNFKKYAISLCILFISQFTCLKAQADIRPGYLITYSGDTIFGLIDFRSSKMNCSVCNFKKSPNEALQAYSPKDIYAYRFIDGKYYVSREMNLGYSGKLVFLEYLIQGKASIFFYQDSISDHYFIENDSLGLREIPYSEKIINKDGLLYLKGTVDHNFILKQYMVDGPEIYSEIDHIKTPDMLNLVKLAKDYHTKVCKEYSCTIFEKKRSGLKLSIEPSVGCRNNKLYSYSLKYNLDAGLLFNILIPRGNERFFFRTGFKMSPGRKDMTDIELIENDLNNKVKLIQVPVQFNYFFSNRRLRPKISGGMNFLFLKYQSYTEQLYSLSFGSGLNMKLFKGVSVDMDLQYEYAPFYKSHDRPFSGVNSLLFNVGLNFDLIN